MAGTYNALGTGKNALLEGLQALRQEVGSQRADVEALRAEVKASATRRDTGAVPARAPFARRGENIMGSRGFRFGKLLGTVGGSVRNEDAKIEMQYLERFRSKMLQTGWKPDRPNDTRSILVPIWPDGFDSDQIGRDDYAEMKSFLGAGADGADPDEMGWLAQKHMGQKTAASPAQSWVDQSLGGPWVGPPTYGTPIELLRNVEAFMSAGATAIPLGPTGRMQWPRLLAATQAGWAGENTQQTPTTAQTGMLNLSAKKAIGVVALPNELLRFGSPAAEQMIRNDLMKSVALVADKGLLEGAGSDNVPLGIVNTTGIETVTPGASNTLAPQDIYKFMSQIEANNGSPTGWIMRPEMAWAIYASRWTPYSGGTSLGGFIFDFIRGTDGTMSPMLAGLPVTRTAQVSKSRDATTRTYILAGNWPDYLFAMFGAIEFTQTDAGYTLLSSDQTAVRAIMQLDGGPQHPGLFALCDSLTNFTVSG